MFRVSFIETRHGRWSKHNISYWFCCRYINCSIRNCQWMIQSIISILIEAIYI